MKSLSILIESAPLLLQGLRTTLLLWLSCAVISIIVGTLFGIVRCRRLQIPFVSTACDSVTFVLRGVPFYVQLLIVYYVLPGLLGINLPAFVAATVSLGLCSAAYTSQSVRAGIDAIADGQWEAAHVLGYSRLQTVHFIILPQMLRTIVPTMSSELDQLLKSTAIVSAIGLLELTRAGMNIVARELIPLPVYLAIALLYLSVSTLLMVCTNRLEKAVWYPR